MFQARFKLNSSMILACLRLTFGWKRAISTVIQWIAHNLLQTWFWAYFKLCSSLFRAWFKPGSTMLDLARTRLVEPSSPRISSRAELEPKSFEPLSSRASLEPETSLVSSRAEPGLDPPLIWRHRKSTFGAKSLLLLN